MPANHSKPTIFFAKQRGIKAFSFQPEPTVTRAFLSVSEKETLFPACKYFSDSSCCNRFSILGGKNGFVKDSILKSVTKFFMTKPLKPPSLTIKLEPVPKTKNGKFNSLAVLAA